MVGRHNHTEGFDFLTFSSVYLQGVNFKRGMVLAEDEKRDYYYAQLWSMLSGNSSVAATALSDDDNLQDDAARSEDPVYEEAFLVVVILSILFCCCFSTLIARRLRHFSGLSARYLSAELTQPLLEEDHDSVFSREGDDWRCPCCGFHNRPSRAGCDACGLPRSAANPSVEAKALRSAGFDEETIKKRTSKNNNGKSGDQHQDCLVQDLGLRQRRAARRWRWKREDMMSWTLESGAHEDDVVGGIVIVLAANRDKDYWWEVGHREAASFQPLGKMSHHFSSLVVARRLEEEDEREEQERDLSSPSHSSSSSSSSEDDSGHDVENPPNGEDLLVTSDASLLGLRRAPPRTTRREIPSRVPLFFSSREESAEESSRLVELCRVSKLSFGEKHLWFEKELEKQRRPSSEGHARLEVRRECLLEDSVQQLLALDEKQLRQWMRVQFVDEPGIDVGGLEREWFGLACSALFDPAVGVFRTSADGSSVVDPSASLPASLGGHPRSNELYEFAGRLVGKAIAEHVPLRAPLSLVVYKIALGYPLEFDDLDSVDQDIARNLRWLVEDDGGVEDLCLDFTVAVPGVSPCAPIKSLFEAKTGAFVGDDERNECLNLFYAQDETSGDEGKGNDDDEKEETGGGGVVHELCRDGRRTRVTDENKVEYAQALWRYHVLECCVPASWRFARGLFSVIPHDLLSVFDAHELDLLVCGSPTIDVQDWADHTEYAGEYRRRGAKHPVIVWFWKAVATLDEPHKAKLLQYCTGCSRVPCHGFRALQRNDGKYQRFCIQSLPRNEVRFPRAHTCFNRLDLPTYSTKDELEASLRTILAFDATGQSQRTPPDSSSSSFVFHPCFLRAGFTMD